jgi:hypothetical protein
MQTEVMNYRGYSISFDTEKEIFLCDVGNDGAEKKSFSATKKAIDDYIKDNQVFVPFEVVDCCSSQRILTLVGIRKDGRFVYDDNGKKIQLSEYNDKYTYLRSDWEKFDRTELNRLNDEAKTIQDKIWAIEKEEKEFLKTLPTLSQLKSKYTL